MSLSFRAKDQAIEFLAIDPIEINSISHTHLIMREGEKILLRLNNEIRNNLFHFNSLHDKIEYLKRLKDDFWQIFNPDSFDKTMLNVWEYNIMAYYSSKRSFDDQNSNKSTRQTLEFRESIDFENLISRPLVLNTDVQASLRKIKNMPLRKYDVDIVDRMIDLLKEKGLLADYHYAIQRLDSPDILRGTAIEFFFKSSIIYSVDETQKVFGWNILGLLLTEINNLKSLSTTMYGYLNIATDSRKILSALRENGVVDINDLWVGVKRIKDGVEIIDNTQKAVIALVEVLQDKGYVDRQTEETPIRRAFGKSFGVNISNRSWVDTPKYHAEYLRYFSRIIPERS